MTVTAENEATEAIRIPKSLEDLFGGQMSCDIAGCKVIFGHPVNLAGDYPAPVRQQLQQAAADHGWKQTLARLFICPDCAAGPLAMVVADQPHWSTPVKADTGVSPVMYGDTVSTIALPAVVEPITVPAGLRPYDSSKGDAA